MSDEELTSLFEKQTSRIERRLDDGLRTLAAELRHEIREGDHALRDELKAQTVRLEKAIETGDDAVRHEMRIMGEGLRHDIQLVAEGVVATHEMIRALQSRVTHIEERLE
jgi:hypothetical protein